MADRGARGRRTAAHFVWWYCLECDEPTYGPPLGIGCAVLDGPAKVRISNKPQPEQTFEPPPLPDL
jgi:hypothetical protein